MGVENPRNGRVWENCPRFKRAKGFEPSTNTPDSAGNQAVSDLGGAKAALANMAVGGLDADLSAVVDAWPDLPEDVRKMIAGVVRLTPRRS